MQQKTTVTAGRKKSGTEIGQGQSGWISQCLSKESLPDWNRSGFIDIRLWQWWVPGTKLFELTFHRTSTPRKLVRCCWQGLMEATGKTVTSNI